MNNENNNDVYREDSSFNNQGIVDSPDQTEPVDQQQTQFPSANRRQNNFGNIAQGLPGKLRNNENNPALGGTKNNNTNNNPAKGQKKPNNNNQNKKDGLGDKNNNQNKNNNNNNKKRNPLPGGGTNKKDDRRGNQPGPKKDNDNNKKSPLAGMNPFARRREMLKSRFGMGRDKKESGNTGTNSGTLAGTTKSTGTKLVKFLFKYKYLAVGAAAILLMGMLFIIIISALSGVFGAISNSSSEYCEGDSYDLSVLDDPKPSYTYTGVFQIKWSKSSAQYKTLTENETYADEEGFLRSGDAYFIALGSYFGIEQDGKKKLVMGTKYSIKLKNGTEFIGILGDAKADQHTTTSSQHAQHITDKSVIEFEMACGSTIDPKAYGFKFKGSHRSSCGGMQSAINKKFNGEIESISLYDESGESCQEYSGTADGGGDFPIRTSYFSQANMDRIFKASKAAKAAKASYPWECPTYAKMRAVEILLDAKNISEEYRKKAIAAINGTTGNGGEWWAPNNPGLRKFAYDSTCTKPKAGSIISWKSNSIYGHVGIIEAVKGDKVIVTDGYRKSHFNYHELTVNGAAHIYGYKKCYGITYLFEYKG